MNKFLTISVILAASLFSVKETTEIFLFVRAEYQRYQYYKMLENMWHEAAPKVVLPQNMPKKEQV